VIAIVEKTVQRPKCAAVVGVLAIIFRVLGVFGGGYNLLNVHGLNDV